MTPFSSSTTNMGRPSNSMGSDGSCDPTCLGGSSQGPNLSPGWTTIPITHCQLWKILCSLGQWWKLRSNPSGRQHSWPPTSPQSGSPSPLSTGSKGRLSGPWVSDGPCGLTCLQGSICTTCNLDCHHQRGRDSNGNCDPVCLEGGTQGFPPFPCLDHHAHHPSLGEKGSWVPGSAMGAMLPPVWKAMPHPASTLQSQHPLLA